MNTATPAITFAVVTPQQLGEQDARNGQPCRPSYHYGEGDDIYNQQARYDRADYIGAYIKAKGL